MNLKLDSCPFFSQSAELAALGRYNATFDCGRDDAPKVKAMILSGEMRRPLAFRSCLIDDAAHKVVREVRVLDCCRGEGGAATLVGYHRIMLRNSGAEVPVRIEMHMQATDECVIAALEQALRAVREKGVNALCPPDAEALEDRACRLPLDGIDREGTSEDWWARDPSSSLELDLRTVEFEMTCLE